MQTATFLKFYVYNAVVKCDAVTDVKGLGMPTKQYPSCAPAHRYFAEVTTDPGTPEETPARIYIFFRSRSHFLFSSAARVCVNFINVIAQARTLLNCGCVDGFWSLNRSRILHFKIFSDPDLDPDSKIYNKSGVGV